MLICCSSAFFLQANTFC